MWVDWYANFYCLLTPKVFKNKIFGSAKKLMTLKSHDPKWVFRFLKNGTQARRIGIVEHGIYCHVAPIQKYRKFEVRFSVAPTSLKCDGCGEILEFYIFQKFYSDFLPFWVWRLRLSPMETGATGAFCITQYVQSRLDGKIPAR